MHEYSSQVKRDLLPSQIASDLLPIACATEQTERTSGIYENCPVALDVAATPARKGSFKYKMSNRLQM